jgi:alpha-L-fucosidase
MKRLVEGPEVIGIVHWGLNTYADREWGYGDEDPALLNPAKFDADQIVGACKAGGIGGLVVVAKHHDGFCLWPTKTTDHNVTKSPFGRDYVKGMEQACRRHGLKFGVYISPWDRNNANYATERYVEIYHAQIKEILGGDYGEIFEMWFDGANGGDGYYGGTKEKRRIGKDYYRFDEVFSFVRKMQPGVAIFAGSRDDSDFRFPGNERGILDPDSRATVCTVGGFADGKYGNPAYNTQNNTGSSDGEFFRVCEADFPLRRGWFYHEKERGTTKSAAYLAKLYLSSVGNGGTMNIGIAPNKDGRLDVDDMKALSGFKVLTDAIFAHEAKMRETFNVVVMCEDVSNGEQVDEWELVADGKAVLRGKSIGWKRIRLLETPCAAKNVDLKILKDGGALKGVSFKLYNAGPELVKTILSATGDDRETDTAKWMMKAASEQ